MNFLEKWTILSELTQGTKVALTNGDTAEFVRLKQKKFIGIMNGGSYDIPVEMFVKVVEVAKKNKDYMDLNKGDYFYISDSKSNALLFTFEEIKGGYIIGINPVSKSKTRIDVDLYRGRIA